MANKKRIVIVKVGNDKFVKYSYVNGLVSFTAFLDREFPDWRWMNVFDRADGRQIGSFTKFKRPHGHM